MRSINTHPNSLRQHRQRAGVTQINLAVSSGISISTINRLENHPLPIRPDTARCLAAALDCRMEDIFPFLGETKGKRHA